MKNSYPGVNPEISEWKGQTITDFQEELLTKVNGRISEKWFYTHMKSDSQSLPRIDVLNMLSKYAGYRSWDEFRHKNGYTDNVPANLKDSNKVFIMVPVMVLLALVIVYSVYRIINTQTYHFTLIDSDTGDIILNTKIQADLLLDGETPFTFLSDSSGRIAIRTDQSRIRLALKAPGYRSDTVTRILRKFNRKEMIKMKSDPYAMMIEYFSETNVKGWQERRTQLEKIFSDNAVICQVPDRKSGTLMELYNKGEFIDKLTMPSSGLKNIAVVSTVYEHGRIAILKFKNHSRQQ